jgi:hypothetical protein
MTTTDKRFDDLVVNFTEYEEKMNKLRRVRIFLVKVIDEASRGVNRAGRGDARVTVPIGYGKQFQIYICIGVEGDTVISLLRNGSIVIESQITLDDLRQIFENPSPVLDAAAQFCQKLGRYEAFLKQMARFNMTAFRL